MHLPLDRTAARRSRTVLLLAGALLLTGCTAGSGTSAPGTSGSGLRATSTPGTPSTSPVAAATAAPVPEVTAAPVAEPVAALGERQDADVLVIAPAALTPDVRRRLTALSDPAGTLALSAGTLRVGARPVAAVGVDASTFRAFTAEGTAGSDPVWQSVARGEAVVSHEAAKAGALRLGAALPLAGPAGQDDVRLGALATTGLPRADLVLDDDRARALGLPVDNAMLLSAPEGTDPVVFAADVREVAGAATVDLLQVPAPVARLTGGEAAEDLGAFAYRYFADGTIEPDARWVRDNIRTEQVPVMGTVTCHRLMLPQLRGALQEVQDAGLAGDADDLQRLLRPALHRARPDRLDLAAHLGHRHRHGRRDERPRHPRDDGQPRRRDLQAVGLRLGRRLGVHRPDALRADDGPHAAQGLSRAVRRTARAALRPHRPCTPPPGCEAAPHIHRPRTGRAYGDQPATGRNTSSWSGEADPPPTSPPTRFGSRSCSASGVSTVVSTTRPRRPGACTSSRSSTRSANAGPQSPSSPAGRAGQWHSTHRLAPPAGTRVGSARSCWPTMSCGRSGSRPRRTCACAIASSSRSPVTCTTAASASRSSAHGAGPSRSTSSRK